MVVVVGPTVVVVVGATVVVVVGATVVVVGATVVVVVDPGSVGRVVGMVGMVMDESCAQETMPLVRLDRFQESDAPDAVDAPEGPEPPVQLTDIDSPVLNVMAGDAANAPVTVIKTTPISAPAPTGANLRNRFIEIVPPARK